jgi:hypothetical protein
MLAERCRKILRACQPGIEVDGRQHAGSTADEQRKRYLEANGYRVLRFWNNEVLANIEGVVEVICEAVDVGEGPPPPTPPHRKRGEGSGAAARTPR